jgi:hypothetical protein
MWLSPRAGRTPTLITGKALKTFAPSAHAAKCRLSRIQYGARRPMIRPLTQHSCNQGQ